MKLFSAMLARRSGSGRVVLFALLLASYVLAVAAEEREQEREQPEQDLAKVDWWKKTNYYHIYLRSFKDSNGDGNGDLRGVIQELDYLKRIGVGTILMAPFYSSPMKDCGYDIDSYVDIQPMFGTMADFDELVSELKKRDMRIVVDFVPNHSSNKHPWFICSERALVEPEKCGKYKDYYVWTDSKRYQGKYPSNWVSVFGGGPAWTWSDIRKQFYLHQFLPEQPDLNFKNAQVRKEFENIALYWLRKGADGLRVDSAIYLIEDDDFADEPPNPDWVEGQDPYYRLLHVNTVSRHESAEIVGEWRRLIEQEYGVGKKVLITEAYDRIPKLIEYYGNNHADRFADLPFNFELFKLKRDNLASDFIENVVKGWIEPTRALKWPDEQGAMSPWIIWVTGNHDNARIANRIGKHNVFFLRLLTYILPGVPVNYYGDELPLHNSNFNSIPQRTIDEGEPTRLPFRAPMAWTADEPAGGFSASKDIWMPLNADWKLANVQQLLANSSSQPKNELSLFVTLQNLRANKLATFVFGDLVFFRNDPRQSKEILAVARTHDRFGNLMMVANLDPNNEMVVRLRPRISSIRSKLTNPPARAQILLANFVDTQRAPLVEDGATVVLEGLVLARSQVILVQYN